MPFNTFVAGATTSAAQVNENFAYFYGDMIPHSEGIYQGGWHDWGSSTYKWRDAYFGTGIIINTKQITGVDTMLDLNSGTLKLKSASIRGATGNSGGSQQEVAQGTISTPDIRDNACTEFAQNGVGSLATGTTITSCQITTQGGDVLIMGMASLQMKTPGSIGFQIETSLSIDREGTALTGGRSYSYTDMGNAAGNSTQTSDHKVFVIDSPAAGTYTYNLRYTVHNGTFDTVATFNLVAVELKK